MENYLSVKYRTGRVLCALRATVCCRVVVWFVGGLLVMVPVSFAGALGHSTVTLGSPSPYISHE